MEGRGGEEGERKESNIPEVAVVAGVIAAHEMAECGLAVAWMRFVRLDMKLR